MSNLTIVGSTGLDDIKTPFGQVQEMIGGSAIYAAIAASYFALPNLVSIAGTDFSKQHKKLLESKKIDISGLVFKGLTFRWSGAYEQAMNEAKTLSTDLNCLALFEPKLSASQRQSKFLFLANTDPDHQNSVIDQMEGKPFIILDTMNFWINSKKESLKKAIKRSNLVIVNEGEARQFFDTPNLIKAGRQFLDLGVEYAIIKKGEHGALLFSPGNFFSAPGYPLENLKDPTGCGDSFAGGLAGFLAKTSEISEQNLRKAIIWGSTIASFCAEEFGPSYANSITKKTLKERYNVFKKIRQF